MTLTLTIGPDLLDYAHWRSCTRCPVAEALEAATCQRWHVYYGEAVPLVRTGDKTYPRTVLPPEVEAWIRRGDAGERVEPITFELEIAEADILTASV